MTYGVENLIQILLSWYSNEVGFIDFMREMNFSVGGLFSRIIDMSKFYIYAYGWRAIAAMVVTVYMMLMLSKSTRPLATLMINEIFKQPFSLLTFMIRSSVGASVWLLKFIVSAIRNTKGEE